MPPEPGSLAQPQRRVEPKDGARARLFENTYGFFFTKVLYFNATRQPVKGPTMDVLLDRRRGFLGLLVAMIAVSGTLLALAPAASADKSDCPAGKICLWSGPTFGGQRSFWDASETGCHALENIDPQSAYNHTSNRHLEMQSFTTILHQTSVGWGFEFTGGMCIINA
jgi:hypothetical protein